MMEADARKIDYAVSENAEILLDLGPVDSVSYKISDRVDNIVLTSSHAQESLPKTIYACHICDKIFYENAELLEHLNLKHSTNNAQTLQDKSAPEPDNSELEHDYHCKKSFTETSNNQCAFDLCQDGSKPYKCAHCGERFKRGSEVGTHMFKHSSTCDYFCCFCGMVFECQPELDSHCALYHSAQKENLMNQHRCGHCGVSFSHRNSLYKHIKSHRDPQSTAREKKASQSSSSGLVLLTDTQSDLKEKKKTGQFCQLKKFQKYSCKFCYSKFQSKESLMKHISSHPEWNPIICEICGEYFTIEHDLKAHLKIHQRKFLQCKICNKVFSSDKKLEKHMHFHLSAGGKKPSRIKTVKVTKPYKNKKICSKKKTRTQQNHKVSKGKTRTKGKKSVRIARVTKKPLTKFKSPTKSNLTVLCKLEEVSHEIIKENNTIEIMSYKCDVCTKSFPALRQLTAHMNKWHCATLAKFDCEYCNSSFSQRMTYLKHLLKHFKKRNYSCQRCSLDFQNAHQLKEHKRSSNGHKQTYTCPLCLKVFHDQLSQKQHREIAHLCATIFKCNVCLRQFISKKLLSQHMTSHRVKKQHRCSMCAQSFNHLSFLFQHLVKHAQRIIYRCQYCSKLFPTQILLHKHLAIHTHS